MKFSNLSLNGLTRLLSLVVFFLMISFSSVDKAAVTAIPDASFEWALIKLGIDSDGVQNGLVKNSDIQHIVSLDLSASAIVDLSGIESFTSLRELNVSKNKLQRLMLCSLSNLNALDCSSNNLLYLDIRKDAYFKKLNTANNPKDLKISRY